jgi:hypothetical protein
MNFDNLDLSIISKNSPKGLLSSLKNVILKPTGAYLEVNLISSPFSLTFQSNGYLI